jgi:hypothetical protein
VPNPSCYCCCVHTGIKQGLNRCRSYSRKKNKTKKVQKERRTNKGRKRKMKKGSNKRMEMQK